MNNIILKSNPSSTIPDSHLASKNKGNNGIQSGKGGMPMKDGFNDGTSFFSLNRLVKPKNNFLQKDYKKSNPVDSSQYLLKRKGLVNKSLQSKNTQQFKSVDKNLVNNKIKYMRHSGSVVPKKAQK